MAKPNNFDVREQVSDLLFFLVFLKPNIIVAEEDGKIVSSCVCIIVPNLTHNQQPYALIENVVTHKDYRKRGLASQCMAFAKQIAREKNCYKIMLLTGTRKRSTHRFYRKNGYNSIEKTGYIQRL